METPTGLGYPEEKPELSSRNPELFEDQPTTEAIGRISTGDLEVAREEAKRRVTNEETVYMEKTVFLSASDNYEMNSNKKGNENENGNEEPRNRQENNGIKRDPVVDYVVNAFSDVCQKIDRIHGIIERKYDLDTLLVHEAHVPDRSGIGVYPADRSGTYIPGKETQCPEKEIDNGNDNDNETCNDTCNETCNGNQEQNGGWFGRLLHKIRVSINPDLTYLSEHTAISDSAVFAPHEHPEYLEDHYQMIQRDHCQMSQPNPLHSLIQQVSTSARDVLNVSSDILRETHGLLLDVKSTRVSFHDLKKDLREKETVIQDLRSKMGRYKQELLHFQAQVSASRESERAVAKIISLITSWIPRISTDTDKLTPNALSLLQQELMLGNTQTLDRILLGIEKAQREVQTESHKQKQSLKDCEQSLKDHKQSLDDCRSELNDHKQLLERQSLEKEAIINQLKEKAEQDIQEKDKVINKQKLLIKVLHAKLTAAMEKKKAATSIPSKTGDKTAPYITELEQRINEIKQKLNSTPRNDPLFSTYMQEVEDCKRRLADFLRIK